MADDNAALEWTDLGLTYAEALHAVQSGVAYSQTINDAGDSPKHLRVGINSAMVSDAAITNLLIKKGMITLDEYEEEIRLAMNNEAARYQLRYGMTFR